MSQQQGGIEHDVNDQVKRAYEAIKQPALDN